MADPTSDDETERIRQAGSTPEGGDRSTHPEGGPEIDSPDDRMQRSAESGEGEVPPERPAVTREQERLEEELPSNRAQERGGP